MSTTDHQPPLALPNLSGDWRRLPRKLAPLPIGTDDGVIGVFDDLNGLVRTFKTPLFLDEVAQRIGARYLASTLVQRAAGLSDAVLLDEVGSSAYVEQLQKLTQLTMEKRSMPFSEDILRQHATPAPKAYPKLEAARGYFFGEAWSAKLDCPKCSHGLHQAGIFFKFDADDYDGKLDGYDGRGEYCVVTFVCEGGHKARLVFGNHKGDLVIGLLGEDATTKPSRRKGTWMELKLPHAFAHFSSDSDI